MSLNKTPIEWVKNPDGTQGYTWNPITGCLNGCPYCYARKLANGRLKTRYLANKNYIGQDTGLRLNDVNNLAGILDPCDDPFYPRFWAEKVKDMDMYGKKKTYAVNIRKPKGIFVCDMGELFGDWVPEYWQKSIFLAIKSNPQHRFYLLTKQPQNLIKFSPFPDNCWVGVTATDILRAYEAVAYLENIEAKIKYLSIEPLLYGGVIVTGGLPITWDMVRFSSISQVIIGAQTKPYKPPKVEWVQEIALACTKAHISLFLKDNLKPLLPNRMPFWAVYYWKEYDKGASITMAENRLRQEIPK